MTKIKTRKVAMRKLIVGMSLFLMMFAFIGCETESEKLKTPMGLKVVALSEDSVKVSWGIVENADGYRIYYNEENSINYASFEVASAYGPNYITITDLEPYTTYYFWVQAYGYGDSSDFSSSKSCKTKIQTPSVSVSQKTSTSVTLWFPLVDGAIKYSIYVGTTSDKSQAKFEQMYYPGNSLLNIGELDLSGYTRGKTYYWFVTAYGEGIEQSVEDGMCGLTLK